MEFWQATLVIVQYYIDLFNGFAYTRKPIVHFFAQLFYIFFSGKTRSSLGNSAINKLLQIFNLSVIHERILAQVFIL